MSHELMDSPSLDSGEVERALRGLSRLNRVSGAAGLLWKYIRPLVSRGEPLTLLDIATGAGDVPVALARLARTRGCLLEVSGCDLRAEMRSVAEAGAEKRGVKLRTFAFDATKDEIEGRYDVVVASLFTHHLSEADVVRLLECMKRAARRMVVVSDLHRDALTLAIVGLASRLVTRSRVVRVDAALSVRAAFTRGEFQALAQRAGLAGAEVHRGFPCRFVMTWRPAHG